MTFLYVFNMLARYNEAISANSSEAASNALVEERIGMNSQLNV